MTVHRPTDTSYLGLGGMRSLIVDLAVTLAGVRLQISKPFPPRDRREEVL